MKKVLLFMGMIIALTLTACSNDSTEAVVEQPEQTGEFADIPLTAQQKKKVPVLNDFALKLARQMAVENKSFVVSPLSVAFLLGMLDEGAEGETQAEIARTLGLGNANREEVNALMAALLGYTQKADPSVTMAYANNVTLNAKFNYQLTETFDNAMKTYYDASVMTYDFSKPEALSAINNWSNEHSRGLIPSIIDELDEDAVMCLLNAIYFKGAWADPFDKSDTSGGGFKVNGEWKKIAMMSKKAVAGYYEEQGFKALRLAIGDGSYFMTLLLPDNNSTVTQMLSSLGNGKLLLPEITEGEVDMLIPIFKTQTETDLIVQLSKLGVKRLFDPDFSQLTRMVTGADNPLYVSLMKQKAQLGVNEEGTEGSAITLAEVRDGATGGQEQPKHEFYATRPFAYYISEQKSGAILFMGVFAGE